MQWYAPACGSHPMTPAVRRGSVIRCSEAYAERDQDGSGNALHHPADPPNERRGHSPAPAFTSDA
jgi:hypothetical protein